MRVLFLISVILLLASCQRAYYAPNGHNVPLLQEKNDAQVYLAQSSGEYVDGYEGMASYAITNHIAVTTAGHLVVKNNDTASGGGSYFEGGIGAFRSFNNHVILECYGGAGVGNVNNDFNLNRYIKNDFTKLYIQPSVGFSSKYFDIALSVRFARLKLRNVRFWQTPDEASQFYNSRITKDYNNLINNNTAFLVETGVTTRFGWKYFKIQMQTSLSRFIGGKSFDIDAFNSNIGLVFTLANKNRPAYSDAFTF